MALNTTTIIAVYCLIQRFNFWKITLQHTRPHSTAMFA